MAGKRKKTTKGAVPFGAVLMELAARIYRQRGVSALDLIGQWPEIIGADLALVTAPERLVRRGGEGVLTIRAAGGSGVEVMHCAPEIIAKINALAGKQVVGQIRVLHAPIDKKSG